MASEKKVGWISDAKMERLKARARKANPHQDSFTHPDAIKSRKQSSAQRKQARWS